MSILLHILLYGFALVGALVAIAILILWITGIILRAPCRRGKHEPVTAKVNWICKNCGGRKPFPEEK
jgi:hypothetical protein